MSRIRPFLPALAAVSLLSVVRVADGQTPAPSVSNPTAPSESQLSPPPDAEKDAQPPGFLVIDNPVFPPLRAPEPAKELGRLFTTEDVAPYLAAGPLAQAKAAFDGGDYERARELFAKQGDSPPVRYLAALSAARAGKPDVALPEFLRLLGPAGAGGYPVLRDRLLLHAALADEDLERWSDAAQLYAEVPPGSKLYVDARFGLFRASRRLGDADGAAAAIAPLAAAPAPMWGRDVAAEALLAQADLAKERRDVATERAALLELWSRHPLTALAAQAERRLRGKTPVDAIVTRAETLIEAHRNEQGIAALEPWLPTLKLPDALACRAHLAYGKALRKEREHTRAIRALTPVVEACKDPGLRARALYVLASSQSIVDQEHGPATYETLARDYPTHSFADDALFYAADLYLKIGDAKSALERLAEIPARYPSGDFVGEALFKSFWILRGQGRRDEALRQLDEIDRLFATAKESYDVERARYWRARMLLDGGQREQAIQLFESLSLEHPATYYGLMARSRLSELAPDRAAQVVAAISAPTEGVGPWPLHAGPLSEDPHLLAGIELLRLGFGDSASDELLAVNRARLEPEPLRLIIHALALAGDAKSAHAIARTELREFLTGPIEPATRPIWEVAYPDAFRPLIEKHCAKAAVDPDLLQALMREESALDPKALSWAGALGLTQLMLSTARSAARYVPEIKRVTPSLLLQPDPNIHLGATHLGMLLKRFDGSKAQAVASYNAGSNAIDRWLQKNGALPLDEWVEEIPIAETRGYVKRVLRSYNTYQLLYRRGVTTLAASASARGPVGKAAP